MRAHRRRAGARAKGRKPAAGSLLARTPNPDGTRHGTHLGHICGDRIQNKLTERSEYDRALSPRAVQCTPPGVRAYD